MSRIGEKIMKRGGEYCIYRGRGEESILLEGAKPVPTHPSDKNRLKAKVLGW